jgi:hypothetical protein
MNAECVLMYFYILILFQIELDKTAEEFRKAHAEREELINQWEFTIDQMQRRDKEMDLLSVVSSIDDRTCCLSSLIVYVATSQS